MAASNNILGTIQGDPKNLRLVHLLAEKTRQGKIAWSKSATGLTASVGGAIGGAMQLSFVLRPNVLSFIGFESWELFTVRESLKDILKIENKADMSRILLSGGEKDPLIEEVEGLFRAATQTVKDDIDKAIEKLEKL